MVLDEADRMLDIGFLPDLERILAYLPKQRTTLLFSATFSPEIKRLAASYLNNPVTIEVARSNATASTVEQRFVRVADDEKRSALYHLIREQGVRQAFIFNNSKLGCARLARHMERDGYKTAALHGDKSQDERLKALDAFKRGEVEFLVCTDVAARGLDIKDVPAVFNFDIPFNAEDYIHRIGRTGRAGAAGLAISLVGDTDARLLAEIAKLTRQDIQPQPLSAPATPASRPRSHARPDDRRTRRDEDAQHARTERTEGRGDRYHRAPKISDPFFERPYEAPEREQSPTWESEAPRRQARPGVSANIRPRSKASAALFRPATPAASGRTADAGDAPSEEKTAP